MVAGAVDLGVGEICEVEFYWLPGTKGNLEGESEEGGGEIGNLGVFR